MLDVGDEIGPYEIVRRLGAGGMGEVFQGRHRHMHRDAAIKVLRAELSTNAEVVRRFFTEARATAAVRHPGIIEIFDCDVHAGGNAYIVMELLDGEDLAKRLADRGAFAGDLNGLRAIARQVAGALGAAHGVGIVHRDLKPGNVFLSTSASAPGGPVVKVTVLDFGIAKLLGSDSPGHEKTQTGSVLGTPLYMSPEQARGARAIDHRADIYALGCVMFEMIAGRPPFVEASAGEVVVAHIFKAAPRVSTVVPAVPRALDDLLAAMLAKEPAERPPSMQAIVERLDAMGELAAVPGARVPTQRLPAQEDAASAGPDLRVATKVLPGPEALASAPPAPRAGRDARQLARAGTTTLGESASELAAQPDEAASGAPVRPTRRRRWLVPALGGAAALVVVVAVVLGRGAVGRDAGSSASSAPALEAAPTPAPAVTLPPRRPAEVTLEVTSQPPGAELWVGQEATPRGRTPLELRVAADAPALRAQLRAPGRASAELVLDPRVARPVTVVLGPAEPSAAPPAPDAPPSGHRHARPSSRAGSSSSSSRSSRAKSADGSSEFKAIED